MLIIWLVILLLLLYVLAFVYSHKFHDQKSHKIAQKLIKGDGYQIFAHRGGLLESPENTSEGLEKVIKSKDHFFETDVHMTKDGQLVCVHDRNLKRITGQDVDVETLNYEEINPVSEPKIIDPNGKTHHVVNPKKLKPVLLSQVLDMIKGTQVIVSIDNKVGSEEAFNTIIEMARERKVDQQIILGSFQKFDYQKVKKQYNAYDIAFFANEPECWRLLVDFFTFQLPFRKVQPDLYCFPYFFNTVRHSETV